MFVIFPVGFVLQVVISLTTVSKTTSYIVIQPLE